MTDDRDVKLMLGALPPSVRDIGIRLVDEVRRLRLAQILAAREAGIALANAYEHSVTESQRAVLDAMGDIPDLCLREWCGSRSPECRQLGLAELALRGLKP